MVRAAIEVIIFKRGIPFRYAPFLLYALDDFFSKAQRLAITPS